MSESELDDLMGEVGGPCNVMGMVNMFQEKLAGDGNDPDELIPLLRTRMVMPRRRRRRRRRPPSKFFQCDQPNLTRIKIGYFPKLLYLNLYEYF